MGKKLGQRWILITVGLLACLISVALAARVLREQAKPQVYIPQPQPPTLDQRFAQALAGLHAGWAQTRSFPSDQVITQALRSNRVAPAAGRAYRIDRSTLAACRFVTRRKLACTVLLEPSGMQGLVTAGSLAEAKQKVRAELPRLRQLALNPPKQLDPRAAGKRK